MRKNNQDFPLFCLCRNKKTPTERTHFLDCEDLKYTVNYSLMVECYSKISLKKHLKNNALVEFQKIFS